MEYIVAIIILIVLFTFYKMSFQEVLNILKLGKVKQMINSQYVINLLSIILAVVSLGFTLDDSLKVKITENSSEYIIIVIIGFLIILILLLNHLNTKNDTILSLKDDLKSETKNLWKKYSDLENFYKENNSKNFMGSFIKNNVNLISIQRYTYSIYINSNGIIIKILGKNSFIRENADLNTVAQGYYTFNPDDIRKLLKAYALCRQSVHTRNLSDDDYKYVEDLFFSWVEELNAKKPDEYIDEDAMKYQLILILKELLETGLLFSPPLPFTEEQLQQINRRKSGIEIAMFLLRDYLNIKSNKVHFEYKGFSDAKKNRLYSNVQVINLNGEKSVFVLAHHGDVNLDESSKYEKVKSDTDAFILLLKNEYDK